MNRTAIVAIALILAGTAITVAGHELPAGLCMFAGGVLAMLAGLLGVVDKRRNDTIVMRAVLLISVGLWVTLTGFALMASA